MQHDVRQSSYKGTHISVPDMDKGFAWEELVIRAIAYSQEY